MPAPAEDLEMDDVQESNMLIDFTDDDANQSQASLQDFLQPLQDTAERVSQQVETFARRLDKFKDELRPSDQELWKNAFVLLEEFTHATESRLDHAQDHRTSSSHDSQAQVDKITLERDLWVLTKNLLLARSPDSLNDVSIAQAEALKDLHRYSAVPELWNGFLDSDSLAQEYEIILNWLQERADFAELDIRSKTQQLMTKSSRGDVRSAAPLFTSYEIKKRKRGNAVGGPLEPATNAALVSHLDPDAPTRQAAKLETQDTHYEEAVWSTCWEMLRRGMKFANIRQWWNDTNEPYRGVVLTVADPSSSEAYDSPFLRIMNLANNKQWLHVCQTIARDATITDTIQRACFGLLSGDSTSSDLACENVDDLAYSLFNALLIERYLHYVSAYRTKLDDRSQSTYQPLEQNARAYAFVRRLRADAGMKDQIHMPHKLTELALMVQNTNGFFLEIGRAASFVAHEDGEWSDLFIQGPETTLDDSVRLLASDEDSIRVIAHLQIVLHSLAQLEQGYRTDDYIMENNIVNYMVYLQKERKLSLLPLYASKLSVGRSFDVLGSTLVTVTDNKERGQLTRLMQKYDLDVAGIISSIVFKANSQNISLIQSGPAKITAPRMTASEGKLQTHIRSNFMGTEISPEDENSIAAVEWYRWVDEGGWGRACFNIVTLYKVWLIKGNFSALKALSERVNLAEVSLAALSMNLAVLTDEEAEQDNGNANVNNEDDAPGTRSPRKRRLPKVNHPLLAENNTRAQLVEQSAIWLQLEQLVQALSALENWQDVANDIDAHRDNSAAVRQMKKELRDVLDEVEMAIDPVLDPSFLDEALDPEDDGVLHTIRTHYLPEIVLGYNSVLYFAGKALTRNNLTKCMDVANTVATTPSLTDAFVQSGRMRELVNAIALDSQDLLKANEYGSRKSSDKKNKGLDLWNVRWNKMEDGMLEHMSKSSYKGDKVVAKAKQQE